eukprot:GHRQ01028119.1.p1 GENE.GHRQ01028119.1~~GHRQ01028119.1.p1  ORF type:complete len:146 (-),score=19.52 GHRQ01028119.1:858-1295(-)
MEVVPVLHILLTLLVVQHLQHAAGQIRCTTFTESDQSRTRWHSLHANYAGWHICLIHIAEQWAFSGTAIPVAAAQTHNPCCCTHHIRVFAAAAAAPVAAAAATASAAADLHLLLLLLLTWKGSPLTTGSFVHSAMRCSSRCTTSS